MPAPLFPRPTPLAYRKLKMTAITQYLQPAPGNKHSKLSVGRPCFPVVIAANSLQTTGLLRPSWNCDEWPKQKRGIQRLPAFCALRAFDFPPYVATSTKPRCPCTELVSVQHLRSPPPPPPFPAASRPSRPPARTHACTD